MSKLKFVINGNLIIYDDLDTYKNTMEKLYEYIDKLHPTATTYELRRYKTMIADIINKAAKGENNIFVQDLEDANDGDKALYIGTKESIDEIKKTYNTYTVSDIIVKILKKEKVDYERLAKEWYEANNIPRTLYTPVFYIKAKIKTPMDKTGVKFRNNYDGRKKSFERMEINKGKSLNYDDMSTFIEKEMKNETAFLTKCNTICNEIMYSLKNNLINSKDATKIFLKLHEGYPEVKDASPFKKATCYMWYLEFENKKSTEGWETFNK